MNPLNQLGTAPIGKLLINMSLPACSGILILMLYNIIDTIFVGQFVGAMAIAGMSVVLPVSMLIPTLGMAVGVGSSSIISRSLGAKDVETARQAFGNAVSLAIVICALVSLLGGLFATEILTVFGGHGEILPYAMEYYRIILLGIPVLGTWMCLNNTLRAEGHTRVSVRSMWLSSAVNLVLDIVFIVLLKMGLAGAAIATILSQLVALAFLMSFYLRRKSHLVFERTVFPLEARHH